MKKGSTGNTATTVAGLALPIAQELGFVLWDVLFEKEGSEWSLKIIIDKENEPVSIDDCEAMSRRMDVILDEEDPIDQSYCLEVSSAGPERRLTKQWHFEKYIGQKVTMRLIRPLEGQRDFVGTLKSFKEDGVTIISDLSGEKVIEAALGEIAFVRLYMEF